MPSTNLTEVIEQIHHATTPTAVAPYLQILVDTARSETQGVRPLSGISALIKLLEHPNPAVIPLITEAIEQLAPTVLEPLLAAFDDCTDQGIQARIVKILANIGDERALPLLVEMVGVEIANHCQGNVRRIAARGIGKILRSQPTLASYQAAIKKLIWALLHTEDWALRYAAAVSLGEIGTDEAITALQQASVQEGDRVVQQRIQFLLSA